MFYWRNHDYIVDIFVCSRASLGNGIKSVLKEENKKEKKKVHNSAESEQQQS